MMIAFLDCGVNRGKLYKMKKSLASDLETRLVLMGDTGLEQKTTTPV